MRSFNGKVVSTKMPATVVIEREIYLTHPLYKKTIRRTRHLKAHCTLQVNAGDTVKIVACRPISKGKHYQILKKINL